MSEEPENEEVVETKEIDSIVETILGIEFKKTFYIDNTVRYFINGNEVTTFNTMIVGKNTRELIVTITSKI